MGHRSIVRAFAAAALLAGGFALAPLAGLAQDATPAMEGETGMGPHPAHIHAGSCPDVGDVVFPLQDVVHLGDDMGMGTPMAGMEGMESTPMAGMEASPMAGMDEIAMDAVVARSDTELDVALDDILAAEHAINVHLSAEEIGTYIACGDITGEPDGDQLQIELQEQNASGYHGVATLTENNGTTTVVVLLAMSGDELMQEASPTP